jgi:two-component sensor histidine kinase
MNGGSFERDWPAFVVTELQSGRVVAANRGALRLFETSRDRIIGKTTVELGLWRDEGQRNSFLACLEIEGELVRYPVRIALASGQVLEAFIAGEPFSLDDRRLLLTRVLGDPFDTGSRRLPGSDDDVQFLSRAATKFLVDEGTDFFQLVNQELRALIPNSVVFSSILDPESSCLQLNSMSAAESLRLLSPLPAESLAAAGRIKLGAAVVASLLKGEIFEVPLAEGFSGDIDFDPAALRALDAVGVDRYLMIGLTWNGTVYGAVSLLVRPPDRIPDGRVVETFVRQASVALQRNERSRALRESLAEKETLLREIHHRVKNNLQIVASLLKLQGGAACDQSTLDVLEEAADRVQSMALVHTMLYGNRNLSSIDTDDFLRTLTAQIVRGGRFKAAGIRVEFDIQPLKLDPDHAVPIGLILNELVTNALKYGLPGRADFRLSVAFRRNADGLELSVSDSAGALPPDFKPEAARTLGMQLVTSLARQLRGRLHFSAGGETVFRVCFPWKEIE